MNYLISTYHSIWLSSLVTGILAMGLGIFLFRQIVAPIRAVTAAAQQIASGQLQHRVSVTSRDEVGQLAETFNQMADALANDLQTRRNLIADVAHELRTPLSVIRANLEAMLDGVLPANDQEIASLHEEVTLLSRLVADLNLLSIAEAGQLKLEQIEIAPAELVYRVIERMATQAEAQAIILLEEVAPALPMVRADADRLGQVLVNLVGNALRYTPAKGQVIVRAYQETARSIEPEVIISVSDTGSGIVPEDLPHVFDRFYRADKSRTRTSGGSGIGLAIVKQLVEVHGGRVWVESQLGQGTTFFLTLPPS
jgi:signal transduction histidine kinase